MDKEVVGCGGCGGSCNRWSGGLADVWGVGVEKEEEGDEAKDVGKRDDESSGANGPSLGLPLLGSSALSAAFVDGVAKDCAAADVAAAAAAVVVVAD